MRSLASICTLGAAAAVTNPNALQGKCWSDAFSFFQRRASSLNPQDVISLPDDSDRCSAFSDTDKKMMALTMANCHLRSRRSNHELSNTCTFQELYDIDWSRGQDQYSSLVEECLSGLPDLSFQIYIEFLNHVEVICFHVHAKMWQERTEATVHNLLKVSNEVNVEVQLAAKQQESILANQDIAIEQQKAIMADWSKLQTAIDAGHQSLVVAFGEIKQDVEQGHQRFQDIFDELFEIFQKVLLFQKSLKAKLFDLQSIFVYGGLMVVTHYLTNGPRVAPCRTLLYSSELVLVFFTPQSTSVFTLLCGVEFCIVRTSHVIFVIFNGLVRALDSTLIHLGNAHMASFTLGAKFEDESSVMRRVISWTRFSFVLLAAYIYLKTYATFKDPHQHLVETVTQKLNNIHAMIETRLTDDTVYSQSTDVAVPTSQSSTSSWFGLKRQSTATSWQPRKKTDNRVIGKPTAQYPEDHYVMSRLGSRDADLRLLLATEDSNQFSKRVT